MSMKKKKISDQKINFKSWHDMPEMPVSQGSMLSNKTFSWRSIRPVIDPEKCTRCMICWKFCPEPAIAPSDPPVIDYDYCKGCGICIEECPSDAIRSETEGK
jgi:2-oxoacid:acceptor oxidoreductase delta subunit (pyruvate/2-ketoisovalerate family)